MTLQQLVKFLTEERKNKDDAIKSILLANHPAFRRFAALLNVKYRVFFTNRDELKAWLQARSYVPVKKDSMDEDSVAEWSNKTLKKYLKLTKNIFDNAGRLQAYSEEQWKDEWVQQSDFEPTNERNDDVPF